MPYKCCNLHLKWKDYNAFFIWHISCQSTVAILICVGRNTFGKWMNDMIKYVFNKSQLFAFMQIVYYSIFWEVHDVCHWHCGTCDVWLYVDSISKQTKKITIHFFLLEMHIKVIHECNTKTSNLWIWVCSPFEHAHHSS
jgi:hypothetical protein